jgi:hypothetical protein
MQAEAGAVILIDHSPKGIKDSPGTSDHIERHCHAPTLAVDPRGGNLSHGPGRMGFHKSSPFFTSPPILESGIPTLGRGGESWAND